VKHYIKGAINYGSEVWILNKKQQKIRSGTDEISMNTFRFKQA
jgi:hypothetical protein